MGGSSSSNRSGHVQSRQNFVQEAKKPLVKDDSSVGPPDVRVTSNYDTFNGDTDKSSSVHHARLLDPSGHLSQDLREVLEETFHEHATGLAMTREELTRYTARCYPGVADDTVYEDRADYLLSKFGTHFAALETQLLTALEEGPSKDKYVITEDRGKRAPEDEVKMTEVPAVLKKRMRRYSLMSIEERKETIEATISRDVPKEDLVITKTSFLLMYRKACIDRPMMARLELIALGYEQFKSSVMVDRSKSLDILAFKVHQMRNRMSTHFEEKQRLSEAKPPKECARLIADFVRSHEEPLDKNDGNNTFRRRKPKKFGRFCRCFCCCYVLFYKCCCECS